MSIRCKLLGHKEKLVDTQKKTCGRPAFQDVTPMPQPGILFIEEVFSLGWICAREINTYECTRCGEERVENLPVYAEDTIRHSRWLSMQVNGRIVPPLVITTEHRVMH